MMTREEHLAWAKQRAFAYVEIGDFAGAWASFVSDLGKHEETQGHMGIELGNMQIVAGLMKTPGEVRSFIEGFG